MNRIGNLCRGLLGLFAVLLLVSLPAVAQKKPNIIMLMSDDVGWEDYEPPRDCRRL
jgi:hypothetical protein